MSDDILIVLRFDDIIKELDDYLWDARNRAGGDTAYDRLGLMSQGELVAVASRIAEKTMESYTSHVATAARGIVDMDQDKF